jgi:5-methyltetrahydrofolate--homocysteine methyltransferase
MAEDTDLIYQAVVSGKRLDAEECVRRAVNDGVAPDAILNNGLVAAMKEVGDRFERGEFYVPEMLVAARAMQAGLSILRPYLVQKGIKAKGKVVVGSVRGDLHDIGKNLVAMMLEGGGFEIVDLGTDVSPQRFVEAVRTNAPQLVAMSSLLTTTMVGMKATVEALHEAGLRGKVKIMIGGAPVNQGYAEEIGADGYAPDASRAVTLANSLI